MKPTSICRLSLTAPIGALLMMVSTAGSNAAEGTLKPGDVKAVVAQTCVEIARLYPVPELGKRTSAELTRRMGSGEYDGITLPARLAARVTSDLEAVSHDKHLELLYDPVMAAELAHGGPSDAETGLTPSQIESARWENYGFKEVRMLEGQVGYLDLRMFFAPRYAGPTAAAAMGFLAGSKAVIIDLRRNGGGWDGMVTMLAGYFLDLKEAKLMALSRSTLDGSYFASVVPAYLPGPNLSEVPVYLLTSPVTASAAEAFVSILTHASPNVTVVGETTAGAENPVEWVPLKAGFVLQTPCYRKLFFGSRPAWEGTGLVPDIKVPADTAFDAAYQDALRMLSARLTGTVAREKLRWARDDLRARRTPHVIARHLLSDYAGRYRGARVTLSGNALVVEFTGRPANRLLAINDDTFVVAERDDLHIHFVRKDGTVVGFERVYSDGYLAMHERR